MQLVKDGAKVLVKNQICGAVGGGFGSVYHYQIFAGKVADKTCCGVDYQRSSADYEHVRLSYCLYGSFHNPVVKAFFVKDYVRLYKTSAVCAPRQGVG